MESARQQLEHDAATWLHRRELGPWTEQDQAELAQWLDASTANRIAYLRLEGAWEEIGRLKALAPGIPAGAIPTPEQLVRFESPERHRGVLRRQNPYKYALAATLLLALGIGGYLGFDRLRAETYSTPVGGLTSIPLKDGSSIALNTASKIRVRYTQRERHVTLERGEAYFDVARDPGHPFTVTAAGKTITALGTAFSVRLGGSGPDIRVLVTEGSVKVEESQAGAPAILSAGEVAQIRKATITREKRGTAQIDEALSWRSGYLVFQDTPLPEAIAEFNRYNDRQIAIVDSSIDSIRLTGKFRSTNTDALARLLEKSFHVSAHHTEDRILLSSEAQ